MKTPPSSQFKGSALKRLKHNLNNAGLIGLSKAKKTNKSKAARPSALKLRSEAIISSLRANNPFESKVQHTKHDVLGRKLKGSHGRPGLTRQKGLETRKAAIMSDLAKRNRVGGVIDRRIGENDPNMTEEEKMMVRWTREKQRIAKDKPSVYNLDDNDNNEYEGLTHLGRPVEEMDRFDDGAPLSDDDDGNLSKHYSRAMFGGGAGDSDRKSKAEVMKELITKSKQHKAERQMIHRENEDLRLQLDSELDAIRGMLIAGSHKVPVISDTVNDAVAEDDYDLMVRELKFDKRAAPTDRTKTEEELAVEDKRRLEVLESDRLRRMNGEEVESDPEIRGGGYKARRERLKRGDNQRDSRSDGSESDEYSGEDDFGGSRDRFGNKAKNGKSVSSLTYTADGETLASQSIFVKKQGKMGSEQGSGLDASEDDEECATGLDSGSCRDGSEDGSDDEDAGIFSNEDEFEASSSLDQAESDCESDMSGSLMSDDTEAQVPSKPKAVKEFTEKERTAMMLHAQEELPYSFPAPSSQEEFDQLMSGRTPDHVAELMARMRKLYHPSLAQDNKIKQHENLGYLMNYVWNLDTQVLNTFNALYPVVLDMAKAYPVAIAQWASDMLGTLLGPAIAPPTNFSLANLCCFKLLCNIFSVSDFHHAVITPLLLTIACYLSRPPSNLSEAATGLFLTELCLEMQTVSKRWVPEVFNYITHLISIYSASDRGLFPTIDSYAAGSLSSAPRPLKLGHSESAPNTHSSILMVCMRQLEQLDTLYAKCFESLPELYAPVIDILENLPRVTANLLKQADPCPNSVHPSLIDIRDRVLDSMRKNIARPTRTVLQILKRRAKAIPLSDPAFDDYYSLDRKYQEDPNADVETEKLKAQYKRERKGAIRELRRDAEFLATVKINEQRKKDKEYETKMRRIEGTLGDEIGELKKLKRESKRRKL